MDMYQKRQGMAAVIDVKLDTQKLQKTAFGVLGGRKKQFGKNIKK